MHAIGHNRVSVTQAAQVHVQTNWGAMDNMDSTTMDSCCCWCFFFFFKCLMALLFFQLLLVHWNTSLGAHLDCSPPGDGFLQLPFFLQPILQDVCAKHLVAIVHINERNSHGRSYFDKKGKNSCCIPANVHFQHVLTPDNNFPCFSSHSRKWKWNEWV